MDGSKLGQDDWPLRRAMRGESVRNEVLTILDAVGARRSYNISAGPMRDRSGGVDLVIETVSDITERVLAQERERSQLARASEVLSSSLDYEETVQTVADLAVPHFADWCVVQLADEEGQPRRIAVAHRDADKLAWVLEASKDYPEHPDSPGSVASILRDGHTVYVPEITTEQVEAAARDERHLDLLRSLSLHSALSVPLVASGRNIGVLTLVHGESGRRFEPEASPSPRISRRARHPRTRRPACSAKASGSSGSSTRRATPSSPSASTGRSPTPTRAKSSSSAAIRQRSSGRPSTGTSTRRIRRRSATRFGGSTRARPTPAP